ncbi:MAG: hypothetical protein IPN86_10690 [Saprospiraceae bacterium]|nr:hypothetical protein [Saprospiraceae bacterium]
MTYVATWRSLIEISYCRGYNEVCNSGTVRRTFTVKKGTVEVKCVQHITVTTITAPFTVTFAQNNQTTVWDKCSFTLDDARDASNPTIKKPIVNYGQCDIVGENIKIDTFLFEDGACKKWRVEYTYINWVCTYGTKHIGWICTLLYIQRRYRTSIDLYQPNVCSNTKHTKSKRRL